MTPRLSQAFATEEGNKKIPRPCGVESQVGEGTTHRRDPTHPFSPPRRRRGGEKGEREGERGGGGPV